MLHSIRKKYTGEELCVYPVRVWVFSPQKKSNMLLMVHKNEERNLLHSVLNMRNFNFVSLFIITRNCYYGNHNYIKIFQQEVEKKNTQPLHKNIKNKYIGGRNEVFDINKVSTYCILRTFVWVYFEERFFFLLSVLVTITNHLQTGGLKGGSDASLLRVPIIMHLQGKTKWSFCSDPLCYLGHWGQLAVFLAYC